MPIRFRELEMSSGTLFCSVTHATYMLLDSSLHSMYLGSKFRADYISKIKHIEDVLLQSYKLGINIILGSLDNQKE